MAKNKRANKKKSGKSKKKNGGKVAPNVSMLAMGVCSLSNPFCPEANGARWPDNSYTKSATFDLFGYNAGNLTTSAGGSTSSLVAFDWGYNGAGASGGVYPTQTYTTLAGPTFPSNVSRYRITSCGMRIVGTVAPMYAQGTLRIRCFSPLTGSSLGSVVVTTTMADVVYDIPLARLTGRDIFINFAPLGDQLARQFRPTSAVTSTLANWVNPGWQCATVAVDGGPASTAVATIYVYAHYEFVPDDGDALNAYTRAPPRSNPVLREANAGVIERVGNVIEGTAQYVDRLFKSKAVQYLAAGAASLVTRNPGVGLAMLANRPSHIEDVD